MFDAVNDRGVVVDILILSNRGTTSYQRVVVNQLKYHDPQWLNSNRFCITLTTTPTMRCTDIFALATGGVILGIRVGLKREP
jgi:hypothetical protein